MSNLAWSIGSADINQGSNLLEGQLSNDAIIYCANVNMIFWTSDLGSSLNEGYQQKVNVLPAVDTQTIFCEIIYFLYNINIFGVWQSL